MRALCVLAALLVAALAPPPSDARAGAGDGASALARWRAAVGAGSGAVASLVQTTSALGLRGTTTLVVARDGRFHDDTERNGDRTAVVLADGRGWSRDWNGDVTALQGAALRRARTEGFVTAALVFGPPAAPPVRIARDAARDAVLLTFVPAGGDACTFALDPRTGLPIAVMRPTADGELTETLHDWRVVRGRRMAFARALTGAGFVRPATATLQTVAFDARLARTAFARPAPGPRDVAFAHGSAATGIPFNFDSQHIIVQGSVNGSAPLGLLLDTGASQSDINTQHLAEFGVTEYGQTATTGGGATTGYGFARDVTFALAGARLEHQHVGVLDTGGLERLYGMKLGGLLGYDFYSRFVVDVDYAARTMNLYDPRTYVYRGAGVVVPFTLEDGLPYTDGTIAVRGRTIPAHFIIDSGASDTLNFTAPFVKAHHLLEAQAGTGVFATPGSEKAFYAQTNIRGRIDRLSVGGLVVDDIPVNFSVATSGAYSDSSFAGVIGESVMRRYHVIFDYSRRHMILEPTAEAAKPFPERRTFGLTVLASGADLHVYTVTAVRANSPAERDGFRKNDTIVALDGKPAASFTLGELRAALSQDGRRAEVTVRRDGAESVVPVTVELESIDRPADAKGGSAARP